MNQRMRTIPPSVAGVVLAELLLSAAIHAMRPMVSYRAIAMDATVVELGYIAASFAALAVFLAVPIGIAVDRVGERPFILVGAVVIAGSAWGTLAADSVVGLAITQGAMGIGTLAVTMGSHALIANAGSTWAHARHFGIYMSVSALGRALGPPLGALLARPEDAVHATDAVFALGAGLAMAALLVTGILTRPPPRVRGMPYASGRADGAWQALRRPGSRAALVAGIIAVASMTLLLAYLPAYGEEHGLSQETIGIALSVMALTQVLARLNLAIVARRLGHAAATAGSMVLAAAALQLLAFRLGDAQLVLVAGVIGAGLSLGQPLSLVWFASITPPSVVGVVMGIRTTGHQLGQLVLPLLAGSVAGQAGAAGIASIVSTFLAISALDVAASRHELDRQHPRPGRGFSR